ncbi:MAG: hypothetical protein ACJ8AW_25765 [Rhodopila sp.]
MKPPPFVRAVYGPGLSLGLALWLGACATPADAGRMTVAASAVVPAGLQHAMCIRTITGGETTNPLWVSKVDDDGFRTALTASMENAGLIAPPNGCKYLVDVTLLGLSQPAFGLDLEVTSRANYKVYDAAANPILLETISAPFTATSSDSAIAFVRIKRANEGSIRASISRFLDKLRGVHIS